MDTQTGKRRILTIGDKPKSTEVLVNEPRSDCPRCRGFGAILRKSATRPERRRADKAGVPVGVYLPCPECNPKGAADAHGDVYSESLPAGRPRPGTLCKTCAEYDKCDMRDASEYCGGYKKK